MKERKPNGPHRKLAWTPLSTYLDCPQQFLWSYGWVGFDLGGGDGFPKPKPILESEGYSLMGDTIQYAIEILYNQKWYLQPDTLVERLRNLIEVDFRRRLSSAYVDWTRMGSPDEMLQICMDGVFGFLRTMKHNKMVGQYAQAEVSLSCQLGGFEFQGRADLMIRRKDTGLTIYDGKNSLQKGKYTDEDQLRWYALMYSVQTGQLPERLAFIYYRFPVGSPEGGADGLDWVSFNQSDLDRLAETAINARQKMLDHKFDPTPKPAICRLCTYEAMCPARKEQKEANRVKRGITTTLAYGATDESF